MKIDKKRLIICLAIPLVVGGAAGLLTMNSMEAFEALNQPPLSPPGWLFPVVWTVLYVLMGIASYLVSVSDAPHEEKARALWTYGIQLAFNFLSVRLPLAGDPVDFDPDYRAAVWTDS